MLLVYFSLNKTQKKKEREVYMKMLGRVLVHDIHQFASVHSMIVDFTLLAYEMMPGT